VPRKVEPKIGRGVSRLPLPKGRPKEFWEAMLWWLKHERLRHLKDIIQIKKDIIRLEKLGITCDESNLDEFIEVPTIHKKTK
jgi:hypothetical protein